MDVDRERVREAAAGHERDRRDAVELAGVELVEEELEQSGVRRLVRGRRDHERTRAEHLGLELGHGGVAPAQEVRPVVDDIDEARRVVDARELAHPSRHELGDRERPRPRGSGSRRPRATLPPLT